MNEISTRHSTTPIQINDSNTLTIHSGNERQDLCLNRNSLCLLSQEDLILTSLQKLHYIDEKGWIQKDQKIIKAPIYLTPEQVEKIKQSYLAKVFNLVDTLWSMLENHPDDQLFLIGSTVKTLIPKILADYIQALNTLDPLFPPFCFKDQQSRDIDFRFYLPHCDYEFLRAFCLKAEEFLNASGVGQIKVTLPLYIPTDIFASITFIINGLKVDLTFVQKASRLHLFVLDALQLLLKQGTQDDLYLLVSDLEDFGEQAIFDYLLKLIHLHDTPSINENGFPRLMRNITQGFRLMGSDDELNALKNTALMHRKGLSNLLQYCHQEHDEGNQQRFFYTFLLVCMELEDHPIPEEIYKLHLLMGPEKSNQNQFYRILWNFIKDHKKGLIVLKKILPLFLWIEFAKNPSSNSSSRFLTYLHKNQPHLFFGEADCFFVCPLRLEDIHLFLQQHSFEQEEFKDLITIFSYLLNLKEIDSSISNKLDRTQILKEKDLLSFQLTTFYHQHPHQAQKLISYLMVIALQMFQPNPQQSLFLLSEIPNIAKILLLDHTLLNLIHLVQRDIPHSLLLESAIYLIKNNKRDHLDFLWNWRFKKIKDLDYLAKNWNRIQFLKEFYPEESLNLFKNLVQLNRISSSLQWESFNDFFEVLTWNKASHLFEKILNNTESKVIKWEYVNPFLLEGIHQQNEQQIYHYLKTILHKESLLHFNKSFLSMWNYLGLYFINHQPENIGEFCKLTSAYKLWGGSEENSSLSSLKMLIVEHLFRERKEKEYALIIAEILQEFKFAHLKNLKNVLDKWIDKDLVKGMLAFYHHINRNFLKSFEKQVLLTKLIQIVVQGEQSLFVIRCLLAIIKEACLSKNKILNKEIAKEIILFFHKSFFALAQEDIYDFVKSIQIHVKSEDHLELFEESYDLLNRKFLLNKDHPNFLAFWKKEGFKIGWSNLCKSFDYEKGMNEILDNSQPEDLSYLCSQLIYPKSQQLESIGWMKAYHHHFYELLKTSLNKTEVFFDDYLFFIRMDEFDILAKSFLVEAIKKDNISLALKVLRKILFKYEYHQQILSHEQLTQLLQTFNLNVHQVFCHYPLFLDFFKEEGSKRNFNLSSRLKMMIFFTALSSLKCVTPQVIRGANEILQVLSEHSVDLAGDSYLFIIQILESILGKMSDDDFSSFKPKQTILSNDFISDKMFDHLSKAFPQIFKNLLQNNAYQQAEVLIFLIASYRIAIPFDLKLEEAFWSYLVYLEDYYQEQKIPSLYTTRLHHTFFALRISRTTSNTPMICNLGSRLLKRYLSKHQFLQLNNGKDLIQQFIQSFFSFDQHSLFIAEEILYYQSKLTSDLQDIPLIKKALDVILNLGDFTNLTKIGSCLAQHRALINQYCFEDFKSFIKNFCNHLLHHKEKPYLLQVLQLIQSYPIMDLQEWMAFLQENTPFFKEKKILKSLCRSLDIFLPKIENMDDFIPLLKKLLAIRDENQNNCLIDWVCQNLGKIIHQLPLDSLRAFLLYLILESKGVIHHEKHINYLTVVKKMAKHHQIFKGELKTKFVLMYVTACRNSQISEKKFLKAGKILSESLHENESNDALSLLLDVSFEYLCCYLERCRAKSQSEHFPNYLMTILVAIINGISSNLGDKTYQLLKWISSKPNKAGFKIGLYWLSLLPKKFFSEMPINQNLMLQTFLQDAAEEPLVGKDLIHLLRELKHILPVETNQTLLFKIYFERLYEKSFQSIKNNEDFEIIDLSELKQEFPFIHLNTELAQISMIYFINKQAFFRKLTDYLSVSFSIFSALFIKSDSGHRFTSFVSRFLDSLLTSHIFLSEFLKQASEQCKKHQEIWIEQGLGTRITFSPPNMNITWETVHFPWDSLESEEIFVHECLQWLEKLLSKSLEFCNGEEIKLLLAVQYFLKVLSEKVSLARSDEIYELILKIYFLKLEQAHSYVTTVIRKMLKPIYSEFSIKFALYSLENLTPMKKDLISELEIILRNDFTEFNKLKSEEKKPFLECLLKRIFLTPGREHHGLQILFAYYEQTCKNKEIFDETLLNYAFEALRLNPLQSFIFQEDSIRPSCLSFIESFGIMLEKLNDLEKDVKKKIILKYLNITLEYYLKYPLLDNLRFYILRLQRYIELDFFTEDSKELYIILNVIFKNLEEIKKRDKSDFSHILKKMPVSQLLQILATKKFKKLHQQFFEKFKYLKSVKK